jgi:hypothetical protein
LNKKSRYQTINFKIRVQLRQWRHQLILETIIYRDIIHLRNRIYETNFNRKKNDLITKSDDSVDMRCRIFSDVNDIQEQSKRYCFNKKFSISRPNQAHRYLNSLHQKKMIEEFIDLIYVFIDQMIINDLTKSLIKDKFVQFRVALKIE